MSQFRFITFITLIYLLVLQPSTIECRPRNQRIVIGAHEWTVSDEPGWEEVLREAEPIRHRLLSNCASSRECRLAAEQLSQLFSKHSVSSKSFDDSLGNDITDSDSSTIFKWG